MKFVVTAVILVSTTIIASAQARHPCANDAIAKAPPLLRLHFGYEPGQKVENFSIGDEVRALPPTKALEGKGRLDVLEVRGYTSTRPSTACASSTCRTSPRTTPAP